MVLPLRLMYVLCTMHSLFPSKRKRTIQLATHFRALFRGGKKSFMGNFVPLPWGCGVKQDGGCAHYISIILRLRDRLKVTTRVPDVGCGVLINDDNNPIIYWKISNFDASWSCETVKGGIVNSHTWEIRGVRREVGATEQASAINFNQDHRGGGWRAQLHTHSGTSFALVSVGPHLYEGWWGMQW